MNQFYFGCLICGSDNISLFGWLRHCNDCHRYSDVNHPPTFLPGQMIFRTMIGMSGLRHYGVYLGLGWVFHSLPEVGVLVTTVAEFAQGLPVWRIGVPAESSDDLQAIMSRARQKSGASWTGFDNCEDVAFYVRDGIGKSPTRNLLFGLGAAVALIAIANRE